MYFKTKMYQKTIFILFNNVSKMDLIKTFVFDLHLHNIC